MYAASGVLREAEEPTLVLQACTVLVQAIREYMGIMRAIDHPDAS